jgi:hypothetical protein
MNYFKVNQSHLNDYRDLAKMLHDVWTNYDRALGQTYISKDHHFTFRMLFRLVKNAGRRLLTF